MYLDRTFNYNWSYAGNTIYAVCERGWVVVESEKWLEKRQDFEFGEERSEQFYNIRKINVYVLPNAMDKVCDFCDMPQAKLRKFTVNTEKQ